MRKTILRSVVSILLVLVAAAFLYDSGVLYFRYGDVKQAVLHLAAGVSTAAVYVWCAAKLGKKEESIEDWKQLIHKEQRQGIFCILLSGVFETGIALYLCRFLNKYELTGIAGICAVTTLILLMICLVRMKFGHTMAEGEYKNALLNMAKELETKGWVSYSEKAKQFAKKMIETKARTFGSLFCIVNLWIAAMVVVCFRIGVGGYLLPVISAGLLIVLAIRGLSFAGITKELMIALNQRESSDVLAALIFYYGVSDKKYQELAHTVQSYAVAALCDQEAYQEALFLIDKIQRPLKWETYYTQWRIICLEGLKDQQGLKQLLDSKSDLMIRRGKRKKDGWDVFEAATALADKDYEKVVNLVQQNPGSNARIAKSREKFAEDAKKQIFGQE